MSRTIAFILVVSACSASDDPGSTSVASSSSGAGGAGGAPGCAAVTCTAPGEVCIDGACVEDCRREGAQPCAPPTVCNVSDASAGACVEPDAPCTTTSPPEACGSKTCGPGSQCGAGECYPRVPCNAVACAGASCWGTACPCTRVTSCAPAPLGMPGEAGTLHDPAFIDGLVDLEFDPLCTAWGATLISGPDYLRSMTPGGMVESRAGITNLNMGEVAVLQKVVIPRDLRPLEDPALDVSLAYICCSTCGCLLSSTPQGVARLEPATQMLPLVIPSQTFTTGVGPFGHYVIDTGPSGVSYGFDRVLYVGNIDMNGDYYRLDLATQMQSLVTTFASRVHASAAFDALTMIVALEGGELRLLKILDGSSTVFAVSDQPVTGLVRDFFDGSLYVARVDGSVLRYDADATATPYQTTTDPARISVAEDGWLYALEIPYPFFDHVPQVTRWELPKTR